MSEVNAHEKIKEGLLDFVGSHLIGPMDGEAEILEGRKAPHNCYVTGVLYPLETEVANNDHKSPTDDGFEEDDSVPSEGSSSEELRNEVASDKVILPSSAGLSIRCDKATESLDVKVSYGTYSLGLSPSGSGECYVRTPFVWNGKIRPNQSGHIFLTDRWVRLSWHVRSEKDFNVVSITIENRVKPEYFPGLDIRKKSVFKNIGSIWQLNLEISSEVKGRLLRISPEIRNANDIEINSSALLYRNCHPYAFGHNCSVDWAEEEENVRVWTTFFPRFNLYQMIASAISGVDFAIENFTTPDSFKAHGLPALNSLVREYEGWIGTKRQEVEALREDPYIKAAKSNLRNCEIALQRLKAGVALLGTDKNAQDCFVRANQIMALQHDWKKTGRQFRWHPFQIAFFLLNLSGLFDETHPDRAIADLLWFPTGGGKTEAYLLISAFTLLWRRKRENSKGKWGGGTAIILRYTLRLLTQQQLQRAARMICAAEHLRRKYPESFGDAPISLGFWVGADSFPNENKEWDQKRLEGKVFMPFPSCPSCNSDLGKGNYYVQPVGGYGKSKSGITRLVMVCKENPDCAFQNQPLPIYLTDEDVFRFSPTIVVGTVDKFAKLAWDTDAGKLFNRYHRLCQQHGLFHEREAPCSCKTISDIKCAPPELIIQDELHLITGPLGSMVGAFEVAIRALCKSGTVEPKYIASTATIRGAGRQLMDLYRKDSFQFPPSGLDHDHSFFAQKAPSDDKSKVRTYIGISAQGRSGKLITARLYAALNHFYHHHRRGTTFDSADLDFFRTVVGYFNSRKELGGVNSMIGDDVLKWRKYQHDIDTSRYNHEVPIDSEELMGGLASEKVMNVLDRMSVGSHKSPEFVLATNILSVGIDINRLISMVVAGQPKTTSEYIQASSRVGRERSGLVFMNYNWARARDRSHYEKFRAYHEQLYRFVEGISVTPYSPEARRRAMAGTLVTMLRHDIPQLWGDNGAIGFDPNHAHVKKIKEEYLANISDLNTREEVRREIDKFFEDWSRAARGSTAELRYKSSPKIRGVLAPFGTERDNFIEYFVTSLRNVDDEVPLRLIGGVI